MEEIVIKKVRNLEREVAVLTSQVESLKIDLTISKKLIGMLAGESLEPEIMYELMNLKIED